MIKQGKNNGDKLISVPIVKHPAGIYSVGFRGWINECASEYYNVEEIVGHEFFQ